MHHDDDDGGSERNRVAIATTIVSAIVIVGSAWLMKSPTQYIRNFVRIFTIVLTLMAQLYLRTLFILFLSPLRWVRGRVWAATFHRKFGGLGPIPAQLLEKLFLLYFGLKRNWVDGDATAS